MKQVLTEQSYNVDELGRIVIEDPALLAMINGAQGSIDGLDGNLLNGACSNSNCR